MSRRPTFSVEVRALAAVLALASILILAVAASALGAFLMKRTVAIAVLGGLAIVLSGCASMSPFAVDTKADPAAQKVQADAKAVVDKQMIDRLDHCTLTGQWSMGAGGLAGTGTGVSLGGGVQCAAKPWDAAPPAAPTPSAATP